jgi:sec-independent protein translocase protein TatC
MARALRLPKLPSTPRLPNRGQEPDEAFEDVFEEMTLQEHLEELRDRIMRTCIALGIAFVIGMILSRPLLLQIRDAAGATQGFDTRTPQDPITLWVKVGLYIAISIAMPVIVWQLIGFLSPGLTRKEKQILFSSLPFVSLLFFGGAAYGFFVAAPSALRFLSGFMTDLNDWSPEGPEVITFYLTLMIGLGLAFQMPVVMFVLAKLNIVSPKRMRAYRKYSVMVLLVVSAIITPSTDPVNMAFVAVPLLLLYEVGIIIASIFAKPTQVETAT